MGKKLKRYTEEDLARAFRTNSAAVGAKGSSTNPDTVAEMEALMEAGTWTGGFVEGLGYVAQTHVVTGGSSSSGSSSEDWYCPTCGHPYPPDAGSDYTRCSNCGSSLTPGSQVHPSPPPPTGGGGGGTGGGGGWNSGSGGDSSQSDDSTSPQRSSEQFDPSLEKSMQLKGTEEEIKKVREVLNRLPQCILDYLNKNEMQITFDSEVPKDGGYYKISDNAIYLPGTEFINIKLTHEIIHATQHYNDIASGENNLGNSNLEYEAYIMGDFLRQMYAGDAAETNKDDGSSLRFDPTMRDVVEGYIILYGMSDSISISDFAAGVAPGYEKFLEYYGDKDSIYYEPAYSEYDDPEWKWNWKAYFEEIGIKTKE